VLGIALGLLPTTAHAQGPAAAQDAKALAAQISNPIASLVSLPFQMNWDFGVGPERDTRFLVNVQPVMPFVLNERWNLIARVIVPIVSQPALIPGGQPTSGLGDILFSTFFSPSRAKGPVWGAGPVFQLPTTSDPLLGGEKWGAGPTFVVLQEAGSTTFGILANHVWSFAGEEDRSDVSQTFLQPFLAFRTQKAVTFTFSSESSANWEASGGQTWTIPVIANVSKVVKLGRKPMSVGGGAGYYFEKPDGGPEWKFRSVITLLFPA
jgi:hypothetical protein